MKATRLNLTYALPYVVIVELLSIPSLFARIENHLELFSEQVVCIVVLWMSALLLPLANLNSSMRDGLVLCQHWVAKVLYCEANWSCLAQAVEL